MNLYEQQAANRRRTWLIMLAFVAFLAFLGCSNPQDAYSASKGAIAAMTRALAVQLGPQHVRVNALAPGPSSLGNCCIS